jgi:hypothetical protein
MTILPQLEHDLRQAAQRVLPAAADPTTGPMAIPSSDRRRPMRLSIGTAVATISALVAVAVAGLALALLSSTSHRQESLGRGIPSLSDAPTLRRLVDHFAVLRRPQTSADRSWAGASHASGLSAELVPSLTRLAATTRGGVRIFLTVDRQLQPADHRAASAVYSMSVSAVYRPGTCPRIGVVRQHGGRVCVFSAPWGPNVGDYTIVPSPLGPESGASTFVSIVPDGVVRVRWVFRCPAGRFARCHGLRTDTVAPPVHGNVAAAFLPSIYPIPAVTWFDSAGRRVVVYNQHEPGKNHPVPFPGLKP